MLKEKGLGRRKTKIRMELWRCFRERGSEEWRGRTREQAAERLETEAQNEAESKRSPIVPDGKGASATGILIGEKRTAVRTYTPRTACMKIDTSVYCSQNPIPAFVQ